MRSTILTYATLLVSSTHLAQVIQASKVEANLQPTEHYLGNPPELTLPDALLSDPNLTSPPSDNDTEDPLNWDTFPQLNGWSPNESPSAHSSSVGSATAPVEPTGPGLSRKRHNWAMYLDDDDIDMDTESPELFADANAATDGNDMYTASGSVGGIGSLPKKSRLDNPATVEPLLVPPLSSVDEVKSESVDAADSDPNSGASQPRLIIPIPRSRKVDAIGLRQKHLCRQFSNHMEEFLYELIDDLLDNDNFQQVWPVIQADPGNHMSHFAFQNDFRFYTQSDEQWRKVLGYTWSTLSREEGRESLYLVSIALGRRPEVVLHFIRKALASFTPPSDNKKIEIPASGRGCERYRSPNTSEVIQWTDFTGLPLWTDLITNLLLHNRARMAQELAELLQFPQSHWWTYIVKRAYWALFMNQFEAIENMMTPVECGSVEPEKLVEMCHNLKKAIANGTLREVIGKLDDFAAMYPTLGLPESFMFPEGDDMDHVFVSYPQYG
ncbi:hypothetical protein H4R33_003096 [Dimargaris cristalligena]|uniref:Uncharacterized protein n=1 Tax=Dimargaris cristalligena TaxID=215637 RepID=A0A4Q0A0J9_9FUNG|nr:hypothetical protein H4R33_003096 [Dimargaris cristalligena]RKP39248.1 hypothetical protein BJ085DRAFT_39343 [Dimargaris cristalligena]|eukprot:RKP39248.1 hypothetical protein BJ085DRAFT_39343 [Dimargaris cristalligena]